MTVWPTNKPDEETQDEETRDEETKHEETLFGPHLSVCRATAVPLLQMKGQATIHAGVQLSRYCR